MGWSILPWRNGYLRLAVVLVAAIAGAYLQDALTDGSGGGLVDMALVVVAIWAAQGIGWRFLLSLFR